MKNSIKTIIVSGILFLITLSVGFSIGSSAGGLNYRYLPFPIFSECGGYCTSRMTPGVVWWGIASSLIFWILIIEIIHKLFSKKN